MEIAKGTEQVQQAARPARGIIAVDKQGGKILFLDPTSYSTVKVLSDFPPLPHELVLSSNLNYAYIPSYGDGAHGDNPHPNHFISVVDVVKQQRLTDIDIHPFESPHTLRFGPDGLLYVCCENNHAIVVIDPSLNRVIAAIDTGSKNTHRLTLLRKRRELWTENEEDASLSIIDINRREVVGKVALPHPIAGVDVDSTESFVVAVDAEVPQLLIIDVPTRKLIRTVSLEGHSKGSQVARFSKDGRHLLVIGDHEPIVSLLDGAAQQQTAIAVGNKPMDAAFSPDGKTLLVANEDDGTLSVIDLASQTVTNTVSAGKGCETLAYY